MSKVIPLEQDPYAACFCLEAPPASTISAAPLPRVTLPTASEADELLGRVLDAYPMLTPGADDIGFRRQFANSLFFLTHAARQAEPNEKYFRTFWCDQADTFLAAHGIAGPRVHFTALTCAALASGVAYSSLDRFPCDVSLGLKLGQAPRPSTAWRDTLRAGTVPPPTARRTPLPLDTRPRVIRGPSRSDYLRPGRVVE